MLTAEYLTGYVDTLCDAQKKKIIVMGVVFATAYLPIHFHLYLEHY